MSKGLGAFENIFDFLKSECVEEGFQDDYDIVTKELKALETLKDLIGVIEIEQYNKKPNRYALRMCGKVFYINEDEYQALKEELL